MGNRYGSDIFSRSTPRAATGLQPFPTDKSKFSSFISVYPIWTLAFTEIQNITIFITKQK